MASTFISQFTPSLLTGEELERIFVQQSRRELADRIVALVRESVLTDAKHHVLVSGPRGIGKTHLVSVVHTRVSGMSDLEGRILIAWLREEEWGVASFLDLMLRIFRALMSTDGRDDGLPADAADRVEALYGMSVNDAEVAASELLTEITSERTLVVFAENLDELFKGLGEDGQMRLRSYLQEHPHLSIVATTPSLFEAVETREKPFFGFFRTYALDELTHEEAVELLERVAGLKNDTELADFIRTPPGRARVRAIGHLAGGNHRIYITLSEIVNRASLDALVGAVLEMLDRLTPYYQSRMAQLSAQQRKLIEFLCERRGAAPVRDIAARCFVTQQVASAQLAKLRESGYVVSTPEGRESYYEIREPLMRLCLDVKKNRGEPIRLFVEFLRIWYSREELARRMDGMPIGAMERGYFERALELARADSSDPIVRACEEDYDRFRRLGDHTRMLGVARELVEHRGSAWDWFTLGLKLARIDPSKSDGAFRRALEVKADDARDRSVRVAALDLLDRDEEAYQELTRGVQSGPLDTETCYWFGLVALGLGQWELVVGLSELSASLGDDMLVSDRAVALLALGRFNEGLECFRTAAEAQEARTRYHIASGYVVRYLVGSLPATHDLIHRIQQLIDFCSARDMLAELGEGLVQSVVELKALAQQDRLADWLEAWKSSASDVEQLRVPLGLLDAAARYTVSSDRRILLELPIEERAILAPLLGEAAGTFMGSV